MCFFLRASIRNTERLTLAQSNGQKANSRSRRRSPPRSFSGQVDSTFRRPAEKPNGERYAHVCTEFVHNITIQIVTILFKTNSDSLYYTSASAQFILRKYLGLPLLSNTKFSKFKSPRSSCFLRNSNLGKTKLVCVAHLLEELKTGNSNSKF